MFEGQKVRIGFSPLRWIEAKDDVGSLQRRMETWAEERPQTVWSEELTVPLMIDREYKASFDTEGEMRELPNPAS